MRRQMERAMAVEKTACILCSRNCGLVVDVTDGKFAKIRGDDDHPVSKGYLCQKAARLTYYQHHDDRLTHPLRREPDGSFVRVTWDEALDDIAQRLVALRERHGGDAFAFVGGGGQGNHVGGAYSRQLLAAMRSRYAYNALGQEKTGDFWLNGRLFGRQDCHTTEDIEHADYVLVIGANPYQAHGIPNARDTLRDLKKDPARTLVVVDPRRSETAKFADLHLQVRPGADAYLMSAMLAIMLRDGLFDRAFIAQRCTGFEFVERVLRDVPIAEYARRADVPLEDIERVAHGFATARAACLRIDLGIQHTLHTTLNGYLEKLLFLLTGHFGKRGGNNLHSFLLPVIGHTDERAIRHGKPLKRTAHHRMFPIAGIYPPNILPDEIERAGEKRVRAAFVDSANPVVTYADTNAYERAFGKLELLVVIDVAMTETARLAHYVLPAASQFEKWEATGFNLEFPANAFHLRHPLLPPLGESLPEPEIYTRLLEKMGELPRRFPLLERIARFEPRASKHLAYLGALGIVLAANKKWQRHAASIVYRTLGRALPGDAAASAPLLPLAMLYAQRHYAAVRRAGFRGNRATLGTALFRAILERRSGTLISVHEFDEMWRFIRHPDARVHLHIPEMIDELRALATETPPGADYPFVLMAGERRAYNANQIYRDPTWRKVDPHGSLRIHPDDAAALGVADGDKLVCASATGSIEVVAELDDSVRRGMVTLPHGYGMRYKGGPPVGPELNRLTSGAHCDPLSRTPYHKYVPVHLRVVDTPVAAPATLEAESA
ncbi:MULTISPECIES: molybdopterin oxidoreductase family protein [pseudomallei group]|uniref:Molybdopterin oxidoreductase family protein n=3 Tax=Burkholderia mallei TaxID=13373 RepID=A2SB22_BURM9|nr:MULTISPECIES: molybdopterin oxidoreductase family protein [pseudomallei group]ABN00970.1 molybdopterin oxidoreductase family protein [Burkholderia mallei NCTC 10229]AIO82509.2 dehydrogenase [Burkholderia mallei]AOP67444.1 dehydrogenase [Burkholderia mallei]ATD89634.1 dehydrogenase [Burkholderia mallei]ATD94393.1 dehydrogenase [Burkholderia mallei]